MKTKLILIITMIMATTCGLKAQNENNDEDHPGGWDFSIPFLSTNRKANNGTVDIQNGTVDIQYIKTDTNRAPYPHCTSFQFGFISGIDEASGVNIDMGQSFELELRNLVAFTSRLGKWTFFNLGFGVDWRNYRMTGHNQFLLNDDGHITLAPYPTGSNPDFSRIHTFSLVVPLQFHFALGGAWYFSCGPELSFNTYASLKTRYKLDGEKQKIEANRLHRNKVTYGLMCDLTYNRFGVYFKYSPCNVLQPEFGPKFKSITAGLKISF